MALDQLASKKPADQDLHCFKIGYIWALRYDTGLILALLMDFPIQFDALLIVSEYDQEIPQSQTADNPVAPRGRAY